MSSNFGILPKLAANGLLILIEFLLVNAAIGCFLYSMESQPGANLTPGQELGIKLLSAFAILVFAHVAVLFAFYRADRRRRAAQDAAPLPLPTSPVTTA